MPSVRTAVVPLYQGEDWATLKELRAAYLGALTDGQPRRVGDGADAEDAAAAYDAFLKAATERAEMVTLAQLPRSKWRELFAAHPPRPDNEGDKAIGVNDEAFGEALVAASVVDPTFPTDTARDAWLDTISPGDFGRLYQEAYMLNAEVGPDPKVSLSSRLDRTSDETST